MPNINDPDWWKHKPEEAEEPDEPLPEVQSSTERIPSEEEEIERYAFELLTEKGDFLRKNIEAYMRVRNDPEKARNFLHMMLEAHEKGLLFPKKPQTDTSSPPRMEEGWKEVYTWPNEEVEKMLQLDLWIKAVKRVQSIGL